MTSENIHSTQGVKESLLFIEEEGGMVGTTFGEFAKEAQFIPVLIIRIDEIRPVHAKEASVILMQCTLIDERVDFHFFSLDKGVRHFLHKLAEVSALDIEGLRFRTTGLHLIFIYLSLLTKSRYCYSTL